jgi:hypothetical protein
VKNGIQAEAFFRRPPSHPNHDVNGLSVCATYEEARDLFGKGAIKISVEKAVALGLTIENHHGHLTIDEAVPYHEESTYSESLQCANALIKCCA